MCMQRYTAVEPCDGWFNFLRLVSTTVHTNPYNNIILYTFIARRSSCINHMQMNVPKEKYPCFAVDHTNRDIFDALAQSFLSSLVIRTYIHHILYTWIELLLLIWVTLLWYWETIVRWYVDVYMNYRLCRVHVVLLPSGTLRSRCTRSVYSIKNLGT